MKNGWPTTTLGEICVFENGDRGVNYPGRSVQTARGIPFINAGHLTDDGIDLANMNYIPKERFELLGNGKINQGDILFCLRGSLGKCASVGNLSEGAIASSLVIIRPKEAIESSFLLMYLRSDLCAGMIDRHKNGTAQPNLSARSLTKFEIPLPPLPEQRRIVGILDEAFDGIATAKANAEKNFQNARALFESHLNAVFTQRGAGWLEKALGQVAEFKNGLNYTKNSKGQTLHIVGVGDFQSNYIVPIGELQLATIDGKLDDSYAIRRNDVLTVRSNGSKELVGRCMLVPDVSEITSFSGFIIRIRFDAAEIAPRFLLHFMKSSTTRDRLTREGGGTNISNINQTKLSSLPIPIPPFRKQEVIANTLDALLTETQRLEFIYQRKLAALDELKKSLLHQAFSGKL